MPLHLAARMHAFVHSLFRPSDALETRQLYNKVERLFARHGLLREDAEPELITDLATGLGAVPFYFVRQVSDRFSAALTGAIYP